MTASKPNLSLSHAVVIAVGLLFVLTVIIRTAWMCDDAYITMRSVDNAVHGYGLRWNVVERVQSYTHPAWLMLILPFYAVTRDPFYTVLVLQIGLSVAMLAIGAGRLATTATGAALWFASFVSSKALMDFSTSGLENPLVHFLLVLFLIAWLRDRKRPGSLALTGVLTAGLLLCRLDLGALLAPFVITALRPMIRARLTSLAIGLAPFLAWEFFSLIYYGQLVPNTALAKLPPGVATSTLVMQGFKYLAATASFDPMTAVLLGGSCVVLIVAAGQAGRIVAAAVLLHLAAVVSVGGDFMTGRFLTPALVLALAGVLACVKRPVPAPLLVSTAAALVAGSFLGPAPPIATGRSFGASEATTFDRYGVTDERRVYYPTLGLLRVWAHEANPSEHPNAVFARARREVALKNGGGVESASVIGIFGFYAGPEVYVIDRYTLTDAFLARLPAKPGWRVGHYERDVPAGYVLSRSEGRNLIEDRQLRPLFDRVDLVTRGSILNWARLRAVLLPWSRHP